MLIDRRRWSRFLALLVVLATALLPSISTGEEEAEPTGESEGGEGEEGAAGSEDRKDEAAASPFDEIMRSNAPRPPEDAAPEPLLPEGGATVEVPLSEYSELERRLRGLRPGAAKDAGPAVVLGGASYEGEVSQGVLSLRMKLHVALSGDGPKVVPLVGDDVALVSASADGEPIGVTRRPGYHVWITDRRGVIPIEIAMLVAPRGPRGSVEHAFRAARTPSTSLTIRLPGKGLAPELDGAVRTEVRAEAGGTMVHAILAPTTEIRMVGFRELGGGAEAQAGAGARPSAKVYAEASSLLSVDERAIELFTVVRYNVLYGAAQAFELAIPEGLEVVSADGEGGFGHSVEQRGGAAVLRGEAAAPVQGAYEISLRLRRKGGGAPLGAAPGASAALDIALPRCLGVEREHGWLAVEVPGKLRLDEASRQDLTPVEARQLPGEVLGSAVSPILKAYRYHRAAPALRVSVERLPEEELAEGAIDRIDAVSVLSPEGKLLTELRITLRNTLRPSLSLTMPEAMEVRSLLLDGEPVKPSRDDQGRLLLPLKRSRGQERQEPFALVVVLESARPPLGMLGAPELVLPAADLTAAALRWELHLPASNHYGDLRALVGPQTYAGAASWHKPPHRTRAVRWDDEGDAGGQEDAARRPGAPAQIELPRAGVELVHQRYWVSAGEAARVKVPYVRGWLLLPAELLLGILVAAVGSRAGRRIGWGRAARVVNGLILPLPRRARAWWRRQAWPRRRVARAAAMALGAGAVGWMLVDRVGMLARALSSL